MEEETCKFCCQKVPVKSTNATNLKRVQTHHPLQYVELLLDNQNVIKLLVFIKVYSTVHNVYF